MLPAFCVIVANAAKNDYTQNGKNINIVGIIKMLHLQIVFQKVNYRHFFPSQYDNRLPLESVQLRTTQTFVDM